METINWKIINYYINSLGLSLEVSDETLQLTNMKSGKTFAFPWVYSKRCEPSILSKLPNVSRNTILITNRVPLQAAHRICNRFAGYIDSLGNYDFTLGKRRFSHRVSRAASRPEKKVFDFFAPSSFVGGKVYRALLQSDEPLSMRDLSSTTGLSLGAVSEACQYARKMLSLNTQKDLWAKENKTRLLEVWKTRYEMEKGQRFLCFADQKTLVDAIEKGILPFLLIGGDYAQRHFGMDIPRPTLTLCASSPLPEGFLVRFGLIADPNGNVVIRKASAFSVREMQEAYVDEIEAYLTSGLPESPNSDQ